LLKYTIIHVNDRAKENIEYNKNILKDYEYVNDIEFFNGNIKNPWDEMHHRNIRTDSWNPYDGRTFPPLPGELGIWLSVINTWDYIVENNIEYMLVLEDDVKLNESAIENLQILLDELPQDWSFLSLHYFDGQNNFDESTNIDAKYIHRSINQLSAGQAIIYSKSGATKLKKLVRRKGIEYTSDCFIFEQSRVGSISGYSIKPDTINFLVHDYKKIKSLIDPLNVRNTHG